MLLKEPQWILDGNYRKTLGQRLPHADLVIFMDMPRRTCLKGILSRMWTYRILGKTRPCTGPNCPEMISKEFFWYVWNFNKKRRPFVYEELKKHEFPPKPLVIIKNRKQAQKFIEEYPNITDYLS